MRIISWNVNGVRAAAKKGLVEWYESEKPDVLCLQETKATEEQAPKELKSRKGLDSVWASAEKKGYSGVATISRTTPESSRCGFGIPHFDREGRVVETVFPELTLLNVYFPNGGQGPERVAYKLEFYAALLGYCQGLRDRGHRLVVCGDWNTAHQPIDLARPKQNQKTSGFMPEERVWIDHWIEAGFIDTFREFETAGEHYTWWTYRMNARAKNVGWRIDYHFISEDLRPALVGARILKDVHGSDHCPVELELDLSKLDG